MPDGRHSDPAPGALALVLAAGRGVRMRSRLAKVLHPLLGHPMVSFPVRAAQQVGLDVHVVVHHQQNAVREALEIHEVGFVEQSEPRGTGHAVSCALSVLPDQGTLVVLAGDTPLLGPETLRALLDAHGDNLVTVLTASMDEPGEYGRLVRDAQGQPVGIVEASEASLEQLAIREINSGVYAFDLAWLREVVPALPVHEPKGEIYLTDVLALAVEQGRAAALCHDDAQEVLGVNDRWSLARARRVLQERVNRAHALAGVTFVDPGNTHVDLDVAMGQDVTLGAGVNLTGTTVLGEDVEVGAHCVLNDTVVAAGARILAGSICDGAVIEGGARVGPLARLRPGARIGERARVGNFVEVKNSTLEVGATVGHLSYVGDAVVGRNTNVGAGTITCNYDGFAKHTTEIGANAFIGSNTALVAPVKVGE
ncbi:MAG: bifunctional UDP-N-acetylglucosamine diphosphorylase/glucosamine-1-phosphate N-acetyltransferase GlmU, partial [Myxococcota bacterium]|nr:bifunctional UDP-N-acetylglucosamine diphosphorylase/glucosamine-1-phosphate N-acetyltransferase GlmU [Myxococcota bacterium]